MPDNHFSSWITDRDFVSPTFNQDAGGICIRVSVLNTLIPRYSYALGWKTPDGDLKIHLQTGQIVRPSDVADLLTEAQIYLDAELKRIEAIRAQREEADRKRMLDEQQRKQDKKKRYEGNQQRRAEENRDRSRGGSGKKSKQK